MNPARRRREPAARVVPLLLAGCLLASAADPDLLRGQDEPLAWDLPAFHSPYPENGVGLHATFPLEADGAGASVTWRISDGAVDPGLRAGLNVVEGELALLAGGDVRRLVARADGGSPLDLVAVAGSGIGWAPQLEAALVRIPVGVSAGRRFRVAGATMALYAHPRLALDARFSPGPRSGSAGEAGPFRRGDRLSLHADVDLGVELETAGGLRLRAALTLGHDEAAGVGLLF